VVHLNDVEDEPGKFGYVDREVEPAERVKFDRLDWDGAVSESNVVAMVPAFDQTRE
jgi:hypothetical protein